MVVSGFSLLEVRKLYLDELYEYHKALIYTLEKKGEVKEGTYRKFDDADSVNELRAQLLKVTKPTHHGKANSR